MRALERVSESRPWDLDTSSLTIFQHLKRPLVVLSHEIVPMSSDFNVVCCTRLTVNEMDFGNFVP